MNWKLGFRRFLPFAALTALSLLLLPSIFTPGQLLCSATDARNFLLRLNELAWLTDYGVLWPRWAPNLAYGYGYPVFQFYGSLSLYPSLLLHKLGLPQVTAFQAGYWLAFVFSGWATYAWLRSVTHDERAAVMGATAYLFVPYHINAILYRQNLPEPWAMVFAPLALYGLHRMAQRLDWRSVGLTAMAVAALPLTSNLATIVFAPLLITYALLLLYLSSQRLVLFCRQVASAGLAVCLAAFFFIPALADRPLIEIERGFSASGFNVAYNFLDARLIFQTSLSIDISRVNPPYPMSLGPLVMAAALIVLAIAGKRLGRDSRGHALWTIAAGAGCVFMVTHLSAPLYRALPLLNVLQFPWRFLAPATLLIALLAGLATRAYVKTIGGVLVQRTFWLLVTALAFLGWPWLYPGPGCDVPSRLTLRDAFVYQVVSGIIGTSTPEYVPITVKEIPTTSPMVEDYLQERPVIRWDQTLLPAGARTLAIQDNGLSATWEVTTPAAFEATYQSFMFPGWQATIDGQPVEIQIAQPHGLIQISVPAGHHTITVHFGSTPDRIVATGISVVALLAAVGLLLVGGKGVTALSPSPITPLAISAWLVVGGVGISLLAVRVSLVDRLNWLPRIERFDGQTIQDIAHPTSVIYSAGHRLLGYEFLTRPTSNGDALELDLYWATTTGTDFRGLVRLVDDQGTAWTEWNRTVDFPGLIGPPHPSRWGPDLYAAIRYHVDIPPGTPPGEYNLSVATFDPETLAKYYITQGTPLNAERTEAIVGQVTVHREQIKAAELTKLAQPGQPTPAGKALTLVKCDVTRDHLSVGESVVLQLLWYAESPPLITTFTLQLCNAAGRAVFTERLPFSPRYAPHQWQAGELVRDQIQALIPASLPPGQYTWTAEVAGHEVSLGEVTVSIPERRFALPPNVTPVGETLDQFAELAGYQAGSLATEQPFSVTLYWRAREETSQSYKVFVHLVSPQGTIVTQSDGVPAAWTRLTTSWLPPEVIEDTHVLFLPGDLPPGNYRLLVGLYEPVTGRRAVTSQRQDSITLTELSLALP